MINFEDINPNQICSMRSYAREVSGQYTYKEAVWWMGRKAGFHRAYALSNADGFRTAEQIEKSGPFKCKDKKVYLKPHIEIRMSSGHTIVKYFDSEEKLMEFRNNPILKEIKWI
jgi:hypothetical protein